eukprot:TRINITY_DN7352_c0_g1_i10.p2 TRINITY_DN7352_c0_g1~~TRINITY_DN7352_c0_g1_i10.p2  ORF type:complete len:432 (-),score=157.88 TRINITY_DN7352_c0_g1_i10:705-2000(-)
MNSDLGLKEAAAHFLVAAAIFDKIKIEVSGLKPEEVTLDLTEANIEVCAHMIRAQAQRCAYEKVKRSATSKYNLLSQLAMQAAVFYQKAYQLVTTPSMEQAKELRSHRTVLHYHVCEFTSQANYWMAQQFLRQMKETSRGIGIAIGYFKQAYSALKEMEEEKKKLPQPIVNQYENLLKHFAERINNLEGKNNRAFHEEVPKEVEKIECLQYSQPFSLDDDINRPFEGKDIIYRLVPAEVQKLADEYKSFIEGIIAEAQQWITISDRVQESFKKKHDLPACLYAASGEQKVPEDLLAKIQQCKEKGGMKLLRFRLEELSAASETIEMKINNLLIQLQCEEEDDEEFRKLHGALCTQATSKSLTQAIHNHLNDHRESLRKAKTVDASVAYTLEKEQEYLELIAIDKSELINRIPKNASTDKGLSSVALQYFLQ